MGFFKSFLSDLNQARKDIGSGVVDTVKTLGSDLNSARKGAIDDIAANPLFSGIATIGATALGGPWAGAAVSSALAKERGASWGRALATGATTYGASNWLGGGKPSPAGSTSSFGDAAGWGLDDAVSGSAGSSAGTGFSNPAGWGLDDVGTSGGAPASAPPVDNFDFSIYDVGPRQSADQSFGRFMEDFGLADLGGGRTELFGSQGANQFDNQLLESTTPMYDDFYTNPDAFAGYSDAIPASMDEFTTSPTLRSLFNTRADQFMRGANPYIKVARGLDDMYSKRQMAGDLRDRQRQVDDYRMMLENRMNNYYAPGSAEANTLRSAMERRDAAAGRNSQYGTREVNLAAAMAERRAQYAQSMAPSLVSLMQQGNALGGASSALRRGQRAGLWQTGGALRDLFK